MDETNAQINSHMWIRNIKKVKNEYFGEMVTSKSGIVNKIRDILRKSGNNKIKSQIILKSEQKTC